MLNAKCDDARVSSFLSAIKTKQKTIGNILRNFFMLICFMLRNALKFSNVFLKLSKDRKIF